MRKSVPGDDEYSPCSPRKLADIQNGNNVHRSSSSTDITEQPGGSAHSVDDMDPMVEELTVRKYKGLDQAIIGLSQNIERMKQNQGLPLYHPGGGSGSGDPHDHTVCRDVSRAWENPFRELMVEKSTGKGKNTSIEQSENAENKEGSINALSRGVIRTKILSKSRFSEFFVKNTLKGKGIICRGLPRENFPVEPRDQSNMIAPGDTEVDNIVATCNTTVAASESQNTRTGGTDVSNPPDSNQAGVNLRQWLKSEYHKINKIESLYILRQIVELVGYSHANGMAYLDLRPSCFKLLPSNRVIYLGSSVQKKMMENISEKNIPYPENRLIGKRPLDQRTNLSVCLNDKKQKFIGNTKANEWSPQLPSTPPVLKYQVSTARNLKITCPQNYCDRSINLGGNSVSHQVSLTAEEELTSAKEQLEEKWYRSPEELNEKDCTISSNIYSLGVLLFELLARFDSKKSHAEAMLNLRHRILPPKFLSENPKEAGFCLWLLHPEPSLRPTTREVLQSEVFSELQDVCAEELLSSIEHDDDESELILHFLSLSKEQNDGKASKLREHIKYLEVDIEEVEKRDISHSYVHENSPSSRENRFLKKEDSSPDELSHLFPNSNTKEFRLRKTNQLENVYFSMRSNIQLHESDDTLRSDKDLLKKHEKWSILQKDEENHRNDKLGAFFRGLCKYARYSKFEVCGILRNGDFSNHANVICSLSFDRDEDYFASAGVSKKIKIYEFNALFNDYVDIHYPVIEMENKSKLTCVCWNNYIRNYLASTDHEGVVKLWDAGSGQMFSHYTEHEKRAWSVDFSHVDPMKFASGSDDYLVKLWSINERKCLGSIRSHANVCCVQFSTNSTNLLAFGSADYRTYCYDLRHAKVPWCVLGGHEKAVSYVKFLDSETVITASTDNTLKIWDLNKTNHGGLSTDACSLTLRGHSNEKNFVGLSISDDYITCGSETNEVYAYHRSLPMPITSYKFGSIDPISGKEIDDDNRQFVSSVCWRRKSEIVIAANSTGCIKVLQMV